MVRSYWQSDYFESTNDLKGMRHPGTRKRAAFLRLYSGNLCNISRKKINSEMCMEKFQCFKPGPKFACCWNQSDPIFVCTILFQSSHMNLELAVIVGNRGSSAQATTGQSEIDWCK